MDREDLGRPAVAEDTLRPDVAGGGGRHAAEHAAGPGLGLASCFQAVPFQRAISAVPAEPAPTAQASLAEAAATPNRLGLVPGLGLGTCVQAVPFQCAMKVFWLVLVL